MREPDAVRSVMILLHSLAWATPEALTFPTATDCNGRAVDVAMVGDIMQHGEQLKASRLPDGTYNWMGVFEAVAPLLRAADLTIGNLETPVDSGQPYGGYPLFNAPHAVLDALADAGFDILQTANNHCLDRGGDGLIATLKAIDEHGFGRAGTHLSPDEQATPWTLRTLPGNIRVAFLAHTYSTNGEPMPAGEPWRVNWLDEGQMQQDVHRAREHADIVIIGLHWGAEYKHRPLAAHQKLARSLIEAGADVVMGSHPHVLQPAEVVTVADPLGDRDGLILYSLGNFVSNQRTFPRDGGLIARATLQRCSTRIRVVDAHLTPVWVDNRVDGMSAKSYRVLPVPPGDTCGSLDVTAEDCRNMRAFRDHTATLLPKENFSWTTGDHGRLAARPYTATRFYPGPTGFSVPAQTDAVVEPTEIWPLRSLVGSQRDVSTPTTHPPK